MAEAQQKKTITVEQLFQLLADPETPKNAFQDYLVPDAQSFGPFSPQVALNPETVTGIDTAEGQARGAIFLGMFNTLARWRRHRQFQLKMGETGYQGPVIVSEGDSWFQYPVRLQDVIDVLMEDYAVWSLGAAGDTLENMINEGEYLKAVEELHPSIFLISAGGNDMVGGGALYEHLRTYDPGLTPAQHLQESYDEILSRSLQQFDTLFRSLEPYGLQIICHGYDYAIPNNNRWLGTPMNDREITDAKVQQAIAREMVDRFNTRMLQLAKSFSNVTFLDNRNLVTATRWYDELHPSDAGFADVAAKFKLAIQAAMQRVRSLPKPLAGAGLPRTRGAARAKPVAAPVSAARQGARKGVSLHIGLNSVARATMRAGPAH